MKKVERIASKDEKNFIHVLEQEDGSFSLQKFVKKYDSEEDSEYEIRVLPDPDGKFADLSTAIAEAERLLKTCG